MQTSESHLPSSFILGELAQEPGVLDLAITAKLMLEDSQGVGGQSVLGTDLLIKHCRVLGRHILQ